MGVQGVSIEVHTAGGSMSVGSQREPGSKRSAGAEGGAISTPPPSTKQSLNPGTLSARTTFQRPAVGASGGHEWLTFLERTWAAH